MIYNNVSEVALSDTLEEEQQCEHPKTSLEVTVKTDHSSTLNVIGIQTVNTRARSATVLS